MIKNGARPHRALVVLATATEPLTEQEVWSKARAEGNERSDALYHEALNALRNHRYAERLGRRGHGYTWKITEKGRERLEERT